MIYCYNDNDFRKGDIIFVLLNGSIVKGRGFDKTKVCNVSEYIKYNNVLYKCTTSTIIGQDFDSTKFEVVQKGYMNRCSIANVTSMCGLKINDKFSVVGRNDYNIERTEIFEIEQIGDMLNNISIVGES